MKALVTGSEGFVGRHLTAHLEASGDEVIGVDLVDAGRHHRRRRRRSELVADDRARCRLPPGRLGRRRRILEGAGQAFRVNAEGTLNVLGAATEAGVERVLAVSSADVYGKVDPAELPLTEDVAAAAGEPLCRVARSPLTTSGSRRGSGAACRCCGCGRSTTSAPARPTSSWPPRWRRASPAPSCDGGDVLTVGNLTARRDFTDVRDVVRAYRLLMERGEPGEAYNVCSGIDLAVQELADELLAMAKRAAALRDRSRSCCGRSTSRSCGATHEKLHAGHGLGAGDRDRARRSPTCSRTGGAASAPRPESRSAAAAPSS